MRSLKIVQISIEVNSGSVGRIAEQIGLKIIEQNWESYITYARNNLPSKSKVLQIGNKWDIVWHGIMTRLIDNHCFESKLATKRLIKEIERIDPDIIHIHHLHGYYINIKILFNYFKRSRAKVVWTFHDCWSFTGHCTHFEYVNCSKWKVGCHHCPQLSEYPKTLFFDRSKVNFNKKKKIFTSLNNITIVPVSNWLGNIVKESFLNIYPIRVIQNGIDLEVFKPKSSRERIMTKHSLKNEFLIIGVAGTWNLRKGLDYFLKLKEKLNEDYKIILVGLNDKQIKALPNGVIGIPRTENVRELANYYSAADVFVNLTLDDSFPTTNLESLACGTPVITFKTGGSVEAVSFDTGIIISKGDINQLIHAIKEIKSNTKLFYSAKCRGRAENLYNKDNKFEEYIKLYEKLIKTSND